MWVQVGSKMAEKGFFHTSHLSANPVLPKNKVLNSFHMASRWQRLELFLWPGRKAGERGFSTCCWLAQNHVIFNVSQYKHVTVFDSSWIKYLSNKKKIMLLSCTFIKLVKMAAKKQYSAQETSEQIVSTWMHKSNDDENSDIY